MEKRPARWKGEIGLFCGNPLAEEDFRVVPSNRDLAVKAGMPRNQALLNFMWALAGKTADAMDVHTDKVGVMNDVKERLGHFRVSHNTGRRIPRSLTELDGIALRQFAEGMVKLVCTEYVPGMEEGPLLNEVMAMIGGK
jgi:hypothetical protein